MGDRKPSVSLGRDDSPNEWADSLNAEADDASAAVGENMSIATFPLEDWSSETEETDVGQSYAEADDTSTAVGENMTIATFPPEDWSSETEETAVGQCCVPIAPRPATVAHQQQAPADASNTTKKKKGPQKCLFCKQFRKGSCECVKNFPKQLARDMRNQLPPGRVQDEMSEYLQNLSEKEKQKKQRAGKNQFDSFVYRCGRCDSDAIVGHICEIDHIPRRLLHRAREELQGSFPDSCLEVIDTYLRDESGGKVNLVARYRQIKARAFQSTSEAQSSSSPGGGDGGDVSEVGNGEPASTNSLRRKRRRRQK